MKILIVEDEPVLNRSMVEYLSSQQYLCESVSSYRSALEKTDLYRYDCIVLVIISARNELDDKITGLKLGADDYLTKPFHLSELSVRIAAILRRKNQQGNNQLAFEEITIDTEGKTVQVHNKKLILTRKEYELLIYLVINKNRVLSKNTIAEHLWGDDMDVADNYDFLYAHVKNLRKKISQAGAGDYIHSIYGMGYKFSNH